ncbi:MAG TPA: hypothetical protein VMS74_08450 [Acidimicrobiia bacterium]|nr:hypothetical protein [Acidimicrobiia bacterium]
MNDETILGWFAGRVPDGWFVGPVEVTGDRDEIIVTGTLAAPDVGDAAASARQHAEQSRIEGFREDSRSRRMEIASAAERHFQRKVSWSVRCGETHLLFTHLAAPAMTRLRMPERRVLDTLIDAGVARSRSEALQWCVKLVGRHEADWLADLRRALEDVETLRDRGPVSDL